MSDRPDNGERDDASPASVPPPPVLRNTPPPAFRDAPSVDSLLAAAVRGGASADSVGEARAVAAFRAAWESGGRTARTRRRDDWRPNARRRVQLSIRTTLAVLLASLTLGGVAFAAIGSAIHGDKGADREPGGYGNRERPARPTDDAPAWPGPADVPRTVPSTPDTSAPPEEGGASRNPDASDREADRTNDGKPAGDSRQQSPRPAGPNESAGPNEPGGPNGSAGSKVPEEPGRPGLSGGDRPESTAGGEGEGKSEGGAPQNAPQASPEAAPQGVPEADPQAAPQNAPRLAPDSGPEVRGTK
ncbi:hypothetical protein [Streptomyces akebiae]|uniref:Translation initiation factor IF-2 n=1 Tax=Streptomyces akebiae TaxID=2865673 RepID=A0ABX8XPQ8_9ACTN|nr:hypothetical protein [Streptomyces akebiae]QYX77890.1 hypothetical protein K1J60_16320 [Streptomyces akebiae]